MIYKKSILLICCCKLCCVYCGRLRLGQNFTSPKVPPIPGETRDQSCPPDCKENFCGSRQIGSNLNPRTISDTKVADITPCTDPNCKHPEFGINSPSHVGCGTGCTDFLYTLQDKFNLLGWITDLWYFRNHNNKCCAHKHGHTHYTHSLVHSPDEVPEYLTKESSNELAEQAKPLELNQPTDPRS